MNKLKDYPFTKLHGKGLGRFTLSQDSGISNYKPM